MCVRASYMKMTRGANLMQQFYLLSKITQHVSGSYMPIFRSIWVVYYCIWYSALGVVAEVLRSRCVVLCTGVSFVSDS